MVKYLSRLINDFNRDERGAFSVFLVGMFTTLILVGGVAIDLVRYEAIRNSIQYNLDRSVLAAASMRQTQDPEVVVIDYMSKVDMLTPYSLAMDVERTIVSSSGRRVKASATATVDTFFMRIAGISSMDVTATSYASEIIPHLEVSLVLDVSSSMLGGQINALKGAANEFVDTVITENENSRTSISIVPYATNVPVPESMWDLYATEDITENTRCMTFDNDDYFVAAIDPTVTQSQLPYYSSRGTFASGLDFSDCNTAAWAEILPLSTSAEELHAKINALNASGDNDADNTAGHIGTKWGVALLDPAANHLVDDNSIPTPYGQADVLKVLVVMTDGQNTDHVDVADGYRTGLSDMWAVFAGTGSGNFQEYVYKDEVGLYYEVNGDSLGDSFAAIPGTDPNAGSGQPGYLTQYTWSEVWEKYSTEGYGRLIDDDNNHYIEYVHSSSAEADAQMIAACDAAKANGVQVYTISFRITPRQSKELFQECASTVNSYFDVTETEIAYAFASIAVAIQKLRLTQ